MEGRSDEKQKPRGQSNSTAIDPSRRNKSPFIIQDENRKRKLEEHAKSIEYEKAWDGPCGVYEFRVVTLPKAMINDIPEQYKEKSTGTLKLLWEVEWRKQLGITQSEFWEHYEVHAPEPHKLIFRRSIALREKLRRLNEERLERSQRESRNA